jgi:hypothetical protein
MILIALHRQSFSEILAGILTKPAAYYHSLEGLQ